MGGACSRSAASTASSGEVAAYVKQDSKGPQRDDSAKQAVLLAALTGNGIHPVVAQHPKPQQHPTYGTALLSAPCSANLDACNSTASDADAGKLTAAAAAAAAVDQTGSGEVAYRSSSASAAAEAGVAVAVTGRSPFAQQEVPPAVKASLAGLPYRATQHGPPKPGCQEERLAQLSSTLGDLDTPRADPAVDHILRLAAGVFKADCAAVTLLDGERVVVPHGVGAAEALVGTAVPWLYGICGYTLVPKSHEVLVVEDLHKDARFNGVEGWKCGRFYAAAPLVSATGHRLGTMCLSTFEPRSIDVGEVNILCNMAEMVTRRLEQRWAIEQAKRRTSHLSRSLDAYRAPFLFVDASDAAAWRVLFVNEQATLATGITHEAAQKSMFFQLFLVKQASGGELADAQAALAPFATRGTDFTLEGLVPRDNGGCQKALAMAFRPADTAALDAEMPLVGIPAFVPSTPADSERRIFVVEILEAGAARPRLKTSASADVLLPDRSSLSCSAASSAPRKSVPVAFDGLRLGPLLGKGSYGKVYRGWWKGKLVAVKIIESDRVKRNAAGLPLEAVITSALRHPNIVSSLGHAVHDSTDGDYGRSVSLSALTRRSLGSRPASSMAPPGGSAGFPAAAGGGFPAGAHDLRTVSCAAAFPALAAGNPGQNPSSNPSSNPFVAANPGATLSISPAQSGGLDRRSLMRSSLASIPSISTTELAEAVSAADSSRASVSSPTPPSAATLQAQSPFAAAPVQQQSSHIGSQESSVQQSSDYAAASSQERQQGWESTADSGQWGGSAARPKPPRREGPDTWLLLEYCDKGCLNDAIDKGWLRTGGQTASDPPDMAKITAVACGVASAMAYLADLNILHGDLTGGNVLLARDDAAPGGVVARVSDFGLAREFDISLRLEQSMYGTITHMAPELISEGKASKAVDVYAFGVLLWEMYHGARAWGGLQHTQIINAVAIKKQRLQFDASAPPMYAALVMGCMAPDPAHRPTFRKVLEVLQALI